MIRTALIAAGFLALTSGLAPAAPQDAAQPGPPPDPSPYQAMFGARLPRTMALLATSSPQRCLPVKILVYGQSISAGKRFSEALERTIRERFPHADLTYENRSIGGFSASHLIRTATHDVYPFYPDLVIFHVYGGERAGEVERLIANIRRYTTAEILLFSHHVRRGATEVREPAEYWRYFAQKYDCELADVSLEWPEYLKKYGLKSDDLLTDEVHHNQRGAELLATLVSRHLRYNPVARAGWTDTVRTFEARRPGDEGAPDEITYIGKPWRLDAEGAVGEAPEGSLRLVFEGNRVDAIAAHVKGLEKTGTARILIDGRPPSEYPRLYAFTRPSIGAGPAFPGLRRVTAKAPLIPEDWTLRFTRITPDGTDFEFEVTGSKTGFDGRGRSGQDFTSNTGRVFIEARDFTQARTFEAFKVSTPAGFEVKWSAVPMFTDVYRAPLTAERNRVYQTTIAQGLENGLHTLEIVPNGDGPVPIEAIQVHRPPLRDVAEPKPASIVRIAKTAEGGYRLLRNGRPFLVKGAVGTMRLEHLAESGGNAVRADVRALDRAQELGLAVLVGIRIGNPRHGFDYADRKRVDEQFENARRIVQRYKAHPAVLMWALGNEPEIWTKPEQRIPVWKEINRIAQMIHEVDADHPVITVLGGDFRRGMLRELDEHCPALDAIGLNAYQDMLTLPEDVAAQGWKRPYLITEFGPRGHWQVAKTAWKVPIEPSSSEKAEFYLKSYRHAVEGRPQCLGSFAFYWQHKQEKTHTWYGMFLPDGSRTEAIDAMTFAWTGKWPANRTPLIGPAKITASPAGPVFEPGSTLKLNVDTRDPDGDPLDIRWDVRLDVADNPGVGGDFEPSTPPIDGAVLSSKGAEAQVRLPDTPANYRVFVYVYDGKGNAATANLPVRVAAK